MWTTLNLGDVMKRDRIVVGFRATNAISAYEVEFLRCIHVDA
jgi:hypothetical protein